MRIQPETRGAAQDVPYRVVGVKADGFLNVRTGAGVLNARVSAIAANAMGVTISGPRGPTLVPMWLHLGSAVPHPFVFYDRHRQSLGVLIRYSIARRK